jgi:hypothetical protein
LVCDSGGCQIARLQRPLFHGSGYHFLRVSPDFFRVVFDPARLRVYLLVLFLRDGYDSARAIEHDKPCARGALINRANVARGTIRHDECV